MFTGTTRTQASRQLRVILNAWAAVCVADFNSTSRSTSLTASTSPLPPVTAAANRVIGGGSHEDRQSPSHCGAGAYERFGARSSGTLRCRLVLVGGFI